MYMSVKMSQVVIVILCLTVLNFGDGVRIRECSISSWLEIREDNPQADPITCVEFFASDTILWKLSARGAAAREYTCGPGSQQCVSTDANVTVNRTSQGTARSSVLTIVRNPRTVAGNGVVICQVSGQTVAAACFTNVISPARVTLCGVTHDSANRTVSGSCQYDRVYSSNGTYTCTWYRQQTGQSSREHLTTVDLWKTKTSDGDYYRGDCRLPPSPLSATGGTYIYTVDFIPGPDRRLAGTITTDPTSARVVTRSTAVSETPTSPGPTATSVTTGFAVDSSSTSVTSCSRAGSDRGVLLGAVIGISVAALIVIAVLIVIIVVLIRRKRHQAPETFVEESVQTDAPSETNAAYSSLFEDDVRTPGRNPEPTNRDYTALKTLCVQSPAPPPQRRDEAETANTYDLVGAVYENTPASVTSFSPTNIQPSGESQQREQQTSTDYENARPSQQGITRPEEETQRTPNDYYNTRGIYPRPPQSTGDGPDNPLDVRTSHL